LVWANARDNYREYLITGNWGYSFPDELAFNVALAQAEVDPDFLGEVPYCGLDLRTYSKIRVE